MLVKQKNGCVMIVLFVLVRWMKQETSWYFQTI